MAFSYDTVCFPTSPSYRVVTAGGTVATTTQGAHRATLVANLTRLLSEHGVVVEDVEHADGDGCFAMVILARTANDAVGLPQLRRLLQAQGEAWGVSLRVQREDLFQAMHRI